MSCDVFVSSPWVTRRPASDIIDALKRRGLSVFHSPPWNQEDDFEGTWDHRWEKWYGPNLWHVTATAKLIVFVVDRSDWEASSWMIHECEAATRASQDLGASKALTWNPYEINISNSNMIPHMGNKLPRLLNDAVDEIVSILNRRDFATP